MIDYIVGLLKTSTTFIMGFVFGIMAGAVGLIPLLNVEVFGIPLLFPAVFMFVFVGFFVVIFFKKDKIEQIKNNPRQLNVTNCNNL